MILCHACLNDINDFSYVSNSHEFPARMEDNGDNDSTTSESTSESTVPDDDDAQQQQEEDDHDDGNSNVEMIYPVEWNTINGSHPKSSSNHQLGRNWVTQ